MFDNFRLHSFLQITRLCKLEIYLKFVKSILIKVGRNVIATTNSLNFKTKTNHLVNNAKKATIEIIRLLKDLLNIIKPI